jgi:protein-L-isoaspartate(D-aspartate) O-methyltransferase
MIRSAKAYQVMLETDRADFCPRDPYKDSPQSIGSNATISAPHMHAFAIEAALPFIDPDKSQRVLDVGSGSGYLCVAFAKILGLTGKVYGIEHIQPLVNLARKNTEKNHSKLLDNYRVYFICEDGRKGFLPGSPYDIIHVGASSPDVPQALIDQTKVGGVIIIPVGGIHQEQLMKIYKKKTDGSLEDISHHSWTVRYVPLTDTESQLKSFL